MRVDKDGKVEIPPEIREQAGLSEGDEVRFEYDGGAVRLIAIRPGDPFPGKGELLIEHMRRAGKHMTMTAAEWEALVRPPDDSDA